MVVEDPSRLKVESIFTRLLYKLSFSLKNKSEELLGLDILRDYVKRDLLLVTSLLLEKKVISLINSGATFSKTQKLRHIFLTLVCQITENFLMKYYGRPITISPEVVNKCLCNKAALDDIQILFQIPLCSLIDPKCKIFCSTFSPIYSFATDSFLESLFENLIVEISNCVLFIIITEFSEIYDVRQSLYKVNFLSVRNIERFKNNFIWQTTIRVSIQRPKNIYNSLYGLWVIRTTGIYYKVIYANRTNELSKLRKTPLATVTLIELLDFTSSRFDEIFYTLGNGLRFTLTSVVGQIIGLIWRGIIQGLKY